MYCMQCMRIAEAIQGWKQLSAKRCWSPCLKNKKGMPRAWWRANSWGGWYTSKYKLDLPNLEHQGYEMKKDIIYQYNKSVILLETNGKGSSSKKMKQTKAQFLSLIRLIVERLQPNTAWWRRYGGMQWQTQSKVRHSKNSVQWSWMHQRIHRCSRWS